MTLWERAVFVASWLAPLAWYVALVLFAVFVVWPDVGAAVGGGRSLAWVLSLVVLLGLASHAAVAAHSALASHFSRDEKAELRFKLHFGGGYSHWRQLMQKHQRSWYRGRSRSGERPRYD